MKKFKFMAAMAVTILLSSCGAGGDRAQLKSDIDSLSYAIGVSRVEGLQEFLLRNGVDSTMMVEFLEGFQEGATWYEDKTARARLVGQQVGLTAADDWVTQLNNSLHSFDSTMSINRSVMLKGFVDGVAGRADIMTRNAAKMFAEQKQDEIRETQLLRQYGDNKAAGEKFLAENKTKEGVQTTASGLQYKVITEGHGEVPAATSEVRVHYRGTTIDGTEFDSSYSRNEPATFRAGQVIDGWKEALTMMPVGSKWMIYIPQELGYGTNSPTKEIKPYSALIFEVELLEIVKK